MSHRREQKEASAGSARSASAEAQAAAQRKRMVGYGAGGRARARGRRSSWPCSPRRRGRRRQRRAGGRGASRAAAAVPKQTVFDLTGGRGGGLQAPHGQGDLARPHHGPRRDASSTPPTRRRAASTTRSRRRTGSTATRPADEQLVHALEHGRVIIWFKPSAAQGRAREPQGAVRRGHLPDGPRAARRRCRTRWPPPPGTRTPLRTAPAG